MFFHISFDPAILEKINVMLILYGNYISLSSFSVKYSFLLAQKIRKHSEISDLISIPEGPTGQMVIGRMDGLNLFFPFQRNPVIFCHEVLHLLGCVSLERVWNEMNRVRDSYGLDHTKSLDKQQDAVNAFYGDLV